MKRTVLIVEDSPEYIHIVKAGLSSKYTVLTAETGKEALSVLQDSSVDLVLLDVVLPDMHGYQICDFIRSQPKHQNMSVIFLTGQNQIEEKLAGFDHGADDYLTKPFHVKELMARVAANLRKLHHVESSLVQLGDLLLNTQKQTMSIRGEGRDEDLTRIEFKLLTLFARHPDWVFSRKQILEKIWPDKINVSDRTIDSHISNLRKKISNTGVLIEAVHGSGYRLKLENSDKLAA